MQLQNAYENAYGLRIPVMAVSHEIWNIIRSANSYDTIMIIELK